MLQYIIKSYISVCITSRAARLRGWTSRGMYWTRLELLLPQNTFKDIAQCLIRTETTMSATNENEAPVAATKLTGRVKWFNNKTGFGFITALTDSEGIKEGSDVFVHHSAIKVAQEQYRYLVQGEYIEFVLSKLTAAGAAESKHEFQAADVSGVKGGKLICETRWEAKGSGSGAGAGAGANGGSRFNRSAEDTSNGWTEVGAPRKSSFVPRQGSSEWRRGDSSGRGRGRGGARGASDAGSTATATATVDPASSSE